MKFDTIKKNLAKTYDELAKDWGKGKSAEDWGLSELQEFARLVGRGGKVLDLGCGAGVQARQLKMAGLDVVGLDLSPKMIEFAKRKNPDCEFLVGDIENLNFKENYFDGVYARGSLLHIRKRNISKVLTDIFNILKKGGFLYLALKEGEGEGVIESEKYGKKVKRFFSFFSVQEISNYLNDAGFEVLSSSNWAGKDINWIHLFARKA